MPGDFKQKFQQINKILSESHRILLASHENPDPDAVGSVLAAYIFLQRLGKEVIPFLPNPPANSLSFLPGFHEITTDIGPDARFDSALCLDYGDFFRLKLPSNIWVEHLITIDHHPNSSQEGEVVLVAPEYSSTSEIIYRWLKEGGFEVERDMAMCLLAGIIYDTGGLRHVSASAETFSAVSDLVSTGVALPDLLRRIDCLYNISSAGFAGRVLNRICLDENSQLAYSWARLEEVNEFKNPDFYLGNIPTVIASASPINFGLFLLEESDGVVRGSLRCEPHTGRDVSLLAGVLGGGGHKYASGFRYRGSIEGTLKKVLELIR